MIILSKLKLSLAKIIIKCPCLFKGMRINTNIISSASIDIVNFAKRSIEISVFLKIALSLLIT